MLPRFAQAGSRGGPLRPSGSSTVPTNVRPYRFSSGSLRIVVRVAVVLIAVLNSAQAITAAVPLYLKPSSLTCLHWLQGALMCILATLIAAVLPVLAFIFVSANCLMCLLALGVAVRWLETSAAQHPMLNLRNSYVGLA